MQVFSALIGTFEALPRKAQNPMDPRYEGLEPDRGKVA